MITIIHGDDISLSRKLFQELKSEQGDLVLFDGSKITITDLFQNIEGSSLFGGTKMIFIEELLTKLKKTTKESKEILDFINKNAKSSTFILWESKEILKRDLSLLKDAAVRIFKLPKNIFLFLDNLAPGNYKSLLSLFHQALDSGIKEEMILFMIQRQFRILLALCHLFEPEPIRSEPHGRRPQSRRPEFVSGSIDEVSRLAPWQKDKLEKQTRYFSVNSLKQIYKKLYEIEIGQKTGSLSQSLTQSIDFLLLEI